MENLGSGDILQNKKFILVYLVSIILFFAAFYNLYNFLNIKFDILVLFVIFIGGSFSIIYYSKTKNLHRTCFIILLVFGLVMCITTPSFVVCDEIEHYARSDLTAQGILFPEYIDNEGYNVSAGFNQLLQLRGFNILDPVLFQDNGDVTRSLFNGCFPQNLFYPYLISGFGIFLSNLLNLNYIFGMYIGRIFNLLFYCLVCTFAIKKAEKYKLPIFVVSCIPLAVYQAASFSADGFLISVTLLAVAYFINIYKSDIISNRDLGIFFVLITLVSLLKLPYVLLIFLTFFFKKDQFSSKRAYMLSRIIPVLIIIGCSVYSGYASTLLENTLRNEYFAQYNVDPKNQLVYLITHPYNTLLLASSIFEFTFYWMVIDLFRFSYEVWKYISPLLSVLYVIFFAFFSISYNTVKLEFKKRHKQLLAIFLLLIYLGIIFIQYLSWAPLAYPKLDICIGVYSRYYLPLFAFLPLIFNSKRIDERLNIEDYDLKMILGCLIFLSGTIVLTLSRCY